jgi:predicted DsbA family dithiol-disulfide isomerase
LAAVYDLIAQECAEVDMPFRAPTHVPNSRLALETSEVIRLGWPDQFAALNRLLFEAHFVAGQDIGEQLVIDALVDAAGAPTDEVYGAVDAGLGRAAVNASIEVAREHGVAATPAWLFGEDFVVPGVQPRDLFERVITRLRARTDESSAEPGA